MLLITKEAKRAVSGPSENRQTSADARVIQVNLGCKHLIQTAQICATTQVVLYIECHTKNVYFSIFTYIDVALISGDLIPRVDCTCYPIGGSVLLRLGSFVP